MQEQLVAEGRLGKKSGSGVYDWSSQPPTPTIQPGHEASTIPLDMTHSLARMTSRIEVECENPIQRIVFARILFAVMNEALWARHDGVAEANDIDTAMRYGVNYPRGPFEWMDEIGPELVMDTMNSLESMTGEGAFHHPITRRCEKPLTSNFSVGMLARWNLKNHNSDRTPTPPRSTWVVMAAMASIYPLT